MKTLVALDVDGVLIPWDDEAYSVLDSPTKSVYDRFGKRTGFKDWTYHADKSLKFLTFYSKEQLALIEQVGDIRWLSTWSKEDIHNQFSEATGFGPWDTMIPVAGTRYEAEYLYPWWKTGFLFMWIRENVALVSEYDRLIWVDDDHQSSPSTRAGIEDVNLLLARLGVELYIVRPDPVWKRSEIEAWMTSQ